LASVNKLFFLLLYALFHTIIASVPLADCFVGMKQSIIYVYAIAVPCITMLFILSTDFGRPMPEPDPPPYWSKRRHRKSISGKVEAWIQSSIEYASNISTRSLDWMIDQIPPSRATNRSKLRGTNRGSGNAARPYRLRSIRVFKRGMALLSLVAYASAIDLTKQNNGNSEGATLHYGNSEGATLHYAMSTEEIPPIHNRKERFDTDSYQIKIDNCCSRSMTHAMSDFVPGTLKPIKNLSVSGFGGSSTRITHEGTIRWNITDDGGIAREILIPRSLYVPEGRTRLLSPQHMAQQLKDNHPNPRGTWCATYHDSVVLQWNQRTHTKTVSLDPESTNVGTIWSHPGYRKYQSYCTKIEDEFLDCYESEPKMDMKFLDCYEIETELDLEQNDPIEVEEPDEVKGSILEPGEGERQTPLWTDFKLDGPDGPSIIERTKSESSKASPEALLLQLHHKLSHVSMKRLQSLAIQGYLPMKIAKCRIPLCQACVYGKLTRRPWRSKLVQASGVIAKCEKPGQCVSVDQLESSVGGLVGQLKGGLTKRRYKVATIFVDHFSDLSFVHLQTSTNAIETLQAKKEFERYARSAGVSIAHYHADNGRFSDNAWRDDVLKCGQRLTFCGVGAHHQNGKAEKRIRDIQDMARTSLIHANRRWPDAVDTRLWPYALLYANEALIKTPFPGSKSTPLELFSGTKVVPNIENEHPFGCPAYALDGHLQGKQKIPKWVPRSRLAVFLGHSTQHAKSVGLLLSLTTGLVSPQFHVKYDERFETIKEDKYQPRSFWQQKCGFEKIKNVPFIEKPINEESPDIPMSEILELNGLPFQNPGETQPSEIPQSVDVSSEQQVQVPDPVPDTVVNQNPIHAVTRVGREVRAPARYNDYVSYEVEVDDVLESDIEYTDPAAFAASTDPDVMYLHEALKAPDKKEFLKAMEKEVRAHTENANWKVMKRKDVPKDQTVLPAVWAMRRKRDIATQQVYKWKARLNVHGGKQVKGFNYWETYAPVASWSSIRLIMNLATLQDWKMRQLDFVLAFPQAPVETDIYMDIPKGFEYKGNKDDHVLKLVNNLYGQKQAGRVWNLYLTEGLIKLGFKQSKNDPCIYWRDDVIIIIYTDDTIVTGPNEANIDKAISDIGSIFEITHQPKVDDFLGVKVTRNETTNEVTLTQPHLIKSILDDLGLKSNSNIRAIPALSSKLLSKHNNSSPHSEGWHYRSVIGKLNYLEKSSRPDIAFAVHQCARFSENPKEEHTQAVKLIGRYLMGTSDKGIICSPKPESFNCYCDADFSGTWDASIAETDGSTARSRSGYLIMYAGCPLIWASRLQTEIALSTTESEYISLSQALREVLPLMRLVKELHEAKFKMHIEPPQIHCKVFEDNSGALAMAQVPKLRPRTKHINLKYHHFREAVANKEVSIHAIDTKDQVADIFTKPLPQDLFVKFRTIMMGW
jgi:Reverse transcriptase (RNA-dependent DNA polymerase)